MHEQLFFFSAMTNKDNGKRVEQSDLEAKMNEVSRYFSIDKTKYAKAFKEFLLLSDIYREQELLEYPPNPPNEKCNHAILRGFLVSNESGFRTGDLTPLFKLETEDVYIWTHTMNEYSALVSKVSQKVHGEKVWRNAGILLRLADGFARRFELIDDDIDYDWIYNFDPKLPVNSLNFYDEDCHDCFGGSIMKITDYANYASIIELLIRDEKFYVATQNMFTSVYNHSFCFICAFTPEANRPHPNHELPIWQLANAISHFETSIVQATRSIEAILGKPGNRESERRLHRVKERWRNVISIDPDSIFELKNMTYLDYYYELFSVRGEAAHSLGRLPISLSRSLTIEAQAFAFKILIQYFNDHSLDNLAAQKSLQFNRDLVENDPPYSTPLTLEDDYGLKLYNRYRNEI